MDTNMQKYMALVKTVECGSFTRAAELLNYTQSGISRMISDLEREWKITILERSRTGVRLTSDGMKVYPYAVNVCREYYRLQEQIDELNGLDAGIIRIGTFSSVATHWLPNIIRAFQEDYPNIDYELLLGDYTEIEAWIENGRVDIGFLRVTPSLKLEHEILAEDALLVVMPEGHELSAFAPIPIACLENYPFMLLEKGAKAEISEIFEANHVSPKVHFTTWDDYAVMSMVESGLGIAILPELILRRIPYRIVTGRLDVPASRKIGVAYRDRKSLTLAAKKFMEYLNYRDN